jgi:hypothetical protein
MVQEQREYDCDLEIEIVRLVEEGTRPFKQLAEITAVHILRPISI